MAVENDQRYICNNCISCVKKGRKYISTLYNISKSDYGKEEYFSTSEPIVALDMDNYARIINPPCSTVDAVIGVCNLNGKREIKKRLLMVELKMDVVSDTQIKKDDYQAKIDGTIGLLGQEQPFDPTAIFVFADNMIQQARNRISRFRKNWKPTTPKFFLSEEVMVSREILDKPTTDVVAIKKRILEESMNSAEHLYEVLDGFYQRAKELYGPDFQGYKAISVELKNIISAIDLNSLNGDSEIKELLIYLFEDIRNC